MKQLGLFCHLKYMFRHTEARCKFSRCWWNWVCADAQLTFNTVNNVNISERFTYTAIAVVVKLIWKLFGLHTCRFNLCLRNKGNNRSCLAVTS